MKEDKDKDKEAKLEAVKQELNEKIERIMGPTVEKQPPQAKRISPAEPSDPSVKRALAGKDTSQDYPYPSENKVTIEEASEDIKLDKAVDDIAQAESDEVLEAEDKAIEESFAKPTSAGFFAKVKNFLKEWWGNPKKRNITLLIIGLITAILFAVPTSRYFILNNIGIRSSASVKVLDESTRQPLKNVTVAINDQSGTTDENGYVQLNKLKHGKTSLKIERRAFATIEKPIIVGWGSNPLGDHFITPTGLQYTFLVSDFLSGQAIAKAEASSSYASAFSDEDGKIVITLEPEDDADININISAEDYRTEKLQIKSSDSAEREVKMAPSRQHVFVSKRSGKHDIYKIDADGKNEELVLAGTGSERDDIVIVGHSAKNIAAVVSTRENMRNPDGYLLSTLYIIDIGTHEYISLGRSERFQVFGWIEDNLIYAKITSGGSANNPNRHKLISYNYASEKSTEIASTNYFNDVLIAKDKIYYAPSGTFANNVNVSLFGVSPDGTNKEVLINGETWSLFRTGYDKLTIAAGQAWYDYTIDGSSPPTVLAGPPASPRSRAYINNAAGTRSLWIDQRDGKGVLISYDITSKADKNLVTQSGLTSPIRWLNNTTASYRVVTDQETADYVVSAAGGEARKLVDVTNTSGIDDWYYH